ncbi:MAG: CoA pyrophosphatase [Ignavibacteriales bacterium]|nr:CoA pyrophosphatase [Ignavibacteriales bacterium]
MIITVDHIASFLQGFRRKELQKPQLKKAAVLMLFYSKNGELYVLLTKRTEDVEHHKGQISFPGGSQDDVDQDLVVTALRESEEEIGLPREDVRVLGLFDEYETPSGFAITPVVASTAALPPLTPQAVEVAEILEVPLSLFMDKRNERVEQRAPFGVPLEVYFYRFGDHEIWGATAAILRSFLLSLRQSLEAQM